MDTKSKKIIVEGFIIKEEPNKEYDKLLTILTREYGKIKVYAYGVKREHSKNLNSTSLYTYGQYELAINGDYYTLVSSKIIRHYEDIAKDYDKICMASYFLEILYNTTYENIESDDKIDLLHFALTALIKGVMDIKLIKSTFDLKLLLCEGLVSNENIDEKDSELVKYTYNFVLNTPFEKVFAYNIEGKEKVDFMHKVDNLIKNNLNFESKVLKKF